MEGLFALMAFAILFFLMMRFGCGSHVSHGGQHHGKHAEHGEHGGPFGGVYTCPMHPEVRQPSPGTCPKCGMTLEPASNKGGE